MAMYNPYLKEFQEVFGDRGFFPSSYSIRSQLVSEYSWAVPNKKAIEYLASLSPIIDMGAGTGYWSKLIADEGGEVVAFDKQPYYNDWCKSKYDYWFKVIKSESLEILKKYSDYTLFLCWPPYDDSFAYDALKTYQGNNLVYVGEGQGGCTADDEFFNELDANWEEVHNIDIPQWYSMYDHLVSYIRK